jgi:hypothetical protein
MLSWTEKWIVCVDDSGHESCKGFVLEESTDKVRIYDSVVGIHLVMEKSHCCLLTNYLLSEEIKVLVDMALDMGDREWFKQLSKDLKFCYEWRPISGKRPESRYSS